MRLVLAAILLGLVAGPAAAGEPSKKPPALAELTLYSGGKGRVLAFRPGTSKPPRRPAIYMLVGKTFHRIRTWGQDLRKGRYTIRDPRIRGGSRLDDRGSSLRVKCGADELSLAKVSERAAARLRKGTSITYDAFWTRESHYLGRDMQGRYFFVDRSALAKRSFDRRLFIGTRGNMKRIRLKNVIKDEAGDLLVSPVGTLKISRNKAQVTWHHKGKVVELDRVGLSPKTADFIHGDLGVYLGQTFGTPCDWFAGPTSRK